MQQQQAINICWPPHWLTAIVFLTLQQRSFEKSRPPQVNSIWYMYACSIVYYRRQVSTLNYHRIIMRCQIFYTIYICTLMLQFCSVCYHVTTLKNMIPGGLYNHQIEQQLIYTISPHTSVTTNKVRNCCCC